MTPAPTPPGRRTPRSSLALATFALGTILGTPTTAQARRITVQNLAPFPRSEWVSAVVPFARGAVPKLPDQHATGCPTVWQPFGARWPDGSLRQALCLFPLELRAMSERLIELKTGAGPDPVGEIVDPLGAGLAKLRVVVRQPDATSTATPTRVEVLEQNQARQVLLYRCRIGRTGLLFELILTCYRGQAHFQADVALFFSDPTSAAMQVAVQEVAIESSGLVLALRNARAFGVTQQITPAGSRTTLLRDAVLGDGQGIRRSGVLRPPLGGKGPALAARTHDAAALVPVLAATSWRGTGAYGPFGYVPVPPPWLEGSAGRQALALRHRQFVAWSARPGDPFVRCDHMLAKDPSQTGDQGDFGILRLEPVVSTGLPSFLLEVEPSVLQEACRPVHFFEADGTPVRTQKHPDWVVWDGRAHWNKEASPDRLGKPHPQPKFHANGWFGKDRQHWSSNYLCGYYLLTGAAWARREIDNEVQLFLGMQTVRPGLGTTGRGAPRAAGRMLLLGCWLYQCTGDQALLDRMRQRMLVSHLPGWFGRELPEGKVRPLNVHPPDNRVLNGATKFWSPWMEAIAAVGYFALYRTTGDETAKHMADVISATVLQHGWLIDRTGAHVGYAIRWNEDASPITEQQMHAREPTVCHWASGGIGLWALGGVSVALHFAKLRQDTASVAKAERILQMLRAGRMRRTADGWWDPLAAWDAVRDADEEKAK